MIKAERIKQEINLLPPPLLVLVDRYIKQIKKAPATPKTGILYDLAAYQIEDTLPTDLAEQHDHYLYGTLKK